jgi:hypothetical protein
MFRLTLLTGALLTLNARAIDDTDPEPPRANTVFARIVAKKTTYKLDLQGNSPADYKKAAQAGRASAIAIEAELVITNATKNVVRVRVSGAVPKLTLKLEGTGAVDGAKDSTVTKGPLRYQELKPGEKVSIPIPHLLSYQGSKGGTIRHYWTEPGEYKLSASFYTSLDLDWTGNKPVKLNYTTLTAPAITLKVEK